MIIEKSMEFSTEQAITASGYTDGTNLIDLRSIRNIGEGTPVVVHFHVTQAFAGSLTRMDFGVYGTYIDTFDFATRDSVEANVFLGAQTALKSSMVLNSHFYVPITLSMPTATGISMRYLGVYYRTDNTATAGKVTANIVPAGSTYQFTYPKSFTS